MDSSNSKLFVSLCAHITTHRMRLVTICKSRQVQCVRNCMDSSGQTRRRQVSVAQLSVGIHPLGSLNSNCWGLRIMFMVVLLLCRSNCHSVHLLQKLRLDRSFRIIGTSSRVLLLLCNASNQNLFRLHYARFSRVVTRN